MDHKADSALGLSWHDTAWIPHLNQSNILDYFSEPSNPFYNRQCNNENIKMQRLNPDQMLNMTGLEYSLLHAQEPILYVIRKQHRHTPNHVTPLADYYIIAGTVYQAPDLCTVINSRLLNTLHSLQSAFDEAHGYARFHPSRGYSWEFKEKEEKEPAAKDKKSEKERRGKFSFPEKESGSASWRVGQKTSTLVQNPNTCSTASSQSTRGSGCENRRETCPSN